MAKKQTRKSRKAKMHKPSTAPQGIYAYVRYDGSTGLLRRVAISKNLGEIEFQMHYCNVGDKSAYIPDPFDGSKIDTHHIAHMYGPLPEFPPIPKGDDFTATKD